MISSGYQLDTICNPKYQAYSFIRLATSQGN